MSPKGNSEAPKRDVLENASYGLHGKRHSIGNEACLRCLALVFLSLILAQPALWGPLRSPTRLRPTPGHEPFGLLVAESVRCPGGAFRHGRHGPGFADERPAGGGRGV